MSLIILCEGHQGPFLTGAFDSSPKGLQSKVHIATLEVENPALLVWQQSLGQGLGQNPGEGLGQCQAMGTLWSLVSFVFLGSLSYTLASSASLAPDITPADVASTLKDCYFTVAALPPWPGALQSRI